MTERLDDVSQTVMLPSGADYSLVTPTDPSRRRAPKLQIMLVAHPRKSLPPETQAFNNLQRCVCRTGI